MTGVAELEFLRTEQGSRLLAQARETPGDLPQRIATLRKRYPPELVSAAVEQIELRSRGAAKFQCADRMLFTPNGVEQASSEQVAAWRAARFSAGASILDLCCGIGGDAVALSSRGRVSAFDLSPAAACCASHNADAWGISDRVRVAVADVTRLRLRGDAAFFDPSRRSDKGRTRRGDAYQPPLPFVHEMRHAVRDLCVKVSPAIDDSDLGPLDARVEFVSLNGECREAALWFGEIGPAASRSASILPAGAVLENDPGIAPPAVSPPLAWLYEPDPAVIRAHLIPEMARLLSAALLDPQIAYLTAEEFVPNAFATAYRVIEWMPFNLRNVERRLRGMGRSVYAIKRRGVPLDPVELSRRLRGAGDRQAVVVLTRVNNRPAAILCERGDI